MKIKRPKLTGKLLILAECHHHAVTLLRHMEALALDGEEYRQIRLAVRALCDLLGVEQAEVKARKRLE